MEEEEVPQVTLNKNLPSCIQRALYGPQRDQWLKEIVLAYREVVGGIPRLTEALKLICHGDATFSLAFLTTLMNQYGSAPSNMLKDLSSLLLEILVSIKFLFGILVKV